MVEYLPMITGSLGLIAGLIAAGLAGKSSGHSPSSYSGWEGNAEGEIFNRRPLEVDKPTYKVIGPVMRRDQFDAPSDRHIHIRAMGYDEGFPEDLDRLQDPLKSYYRAHPEKMKSDSALYRRVDPQRRRDEQETGNRYVISAACDDAWHATVFRRVDKPAVSDWEGVHQKPRKIKDPRKMTALIKRIARLLGASVVRVAKLNPAWVYSRSVGLRGYGPGEKIEIPDWWVNAIVLGVPHYWDVMYANPTYGVEGDATVSVSLAAARLEVFIRRLGYATRSHGPDDLRSEIIIPPIMIDAGLGEQGRFSYTITPEFGANLRAAVITTDLALEPDRPIDMGAGEFCRVCKLCAEICPVNAISMEDRPGPLRDSGFEGWFIDWEACLLYRHSVPSSKRCRLCLTVCPWTRKGNWIHNTLRKVLIKDPTGWAKYAAVWGAKKIYEMPDNRRYRRPHWGSFREPPWFLKSEDFFEF